MEFTGQAFEEMQEQNIRLMQQLREKDDSNLKLMSEVSIFCNYYLLVFCICSMDCENLVSICVRVILTMALPSSTFACFLTLFLSPSLHYWNSAFG